VVSSSHIHQINGARFVKPPPQYGIHNAQVVANQNIPCVLAHDFAVLNTTRSGPSVQQTLEVGVSGSHQNAAAGHRRDDAAKSARAPTVILLPAASFATPSFVFAEPRALSAPFYR
jgi:hypothetical protein